MSSKFCLGCGNARPAGKELCRRCRRSERLRRSPARAPHDPPRFVFSPPRRPWRIGTAWWRPDKMVRAGLEGSHGRGGRWRARGNDPVEIGRARAKQRRLDRHLCHPELWEER